MMNHINSVARESLSNQTPYAVAYKQLGKEVLDKLEFELIAPDEVLLKPSL